MALRAIQVEGIEELTPEQGEALFDRQAQHYLGISGSEFLRKWNAGEYRNAPEDRAVMLVASLLPFACQNGNGKSPLKKFIRRFSKRSRRA